MSRTSAPLLALVASVLALGAAFLPFPLRAAPSGSKVSYLCIEAHSGPEATRQLNEAAQRGWRLRAGGGAVLCLEREGSLPVPQE